MYIYKYKYVSRSNGCTKMAEIVWENPLYSGVNRG